MWEGIASGDTEDKVTVKEKCEAKHILQAAFAQVARRARRWRPEAHLKQDLSPFVEMILKNKNKLIIKWWCSNGAAREQRTDALSGRS